jgi:hypothetical protein
VEITLVPIFLLFLSNTLLSEYTVFQVAISWPPDLSAERYRNRKQFGRESHMQFSSMRAWKDAYCASMSAREHQVNEFELSDADLAMVQGAASNSASASTSSGLDRLNQFNDSYLQSSNGSVLPLGAVSGTLGKLLGTAGGL